jgi:hypothetical protein
MLAVLSKKHRPWPASQFAVTCIWIWVAGSTAIDVVPVFDAAVAVAGCVSTAVSNAAAPAAASRFIVKKVSPRYSS